MSKHSADALIYIGRITLVVHTVIPERNVELCLK
jgi:hypothetical protein